MAYRISGYNEPLSQRITMRFTLSQYELLLEKLNGEKSISDYVRELIYKDLNEELNNKKA